MNWLKNREMAIAGPLAERWHIRPWEIDELDLAVFTSMEDVIWEEVRKAAFSDD